MDISTLIFGGLIGALIAIPFSYFINLTTPSMKTWLDKRSINNKGKSIKRIKKEYEITKKYKENPEALTHDLIGSLGQFLVIGVFAFIILFAFIAFLVTFGKDTSYDKYHAIVLIIFFIFIFLVLSFMGSDFMKIIDMNRRITQFKEYELSALNRIAELEKSNTHLDKIKD
ncbi:MAG: hypothetical protein HZB50_05780 [Chloroflexi bacterium]|nr:hypothetical protein [Chloroflexota bacterium]